MRACIIFCLYFHVNGSIIVSEFITATGACDVKMQGVGHIVKLPSICDSRFREPCTYLDLYEGAVVEIMGKPTTLMQSLNLSTSAWIESERVILESLICSIGEELRKYGPFCPPGSSEVAARVSFSKHKSGAFSLRQLSSSLGALRTDYAA